MILAEAISIDGGLLFLILVVLVVMLVVALVVGIGGCIWAWRAGCGSRPALAGWIICASLEGLAALAFLPPLVVGEPSAAVLVPLAALGLQVVLFRRGRSRGPTSNSASEGLTNTGPPWEN